jgi:peptidoglycan/xylan/chitin deacetylase (PgdA/CDA1 family)
MSVIQPLKNLAKLPLEMLAARFGHHRKAAAEPQLWIIMYHRVLPASDPRHAQEEPGMIVEPATLKMHLEVFREFFTLIPLREWVARREAGKPLPDKACAITFDDGWLDNHQYAFPLLEQAQVPATLFAVSDMIGTTEAFWPNRIQRLLQLPPEQRADIGWLNDLLPQGQADGERSAQAIYALKSHSDPDLLVMLDEAEQALGVEAPTRAALMDWSQLREIAANPLFDVGSHTRHHIRLRGDLDRQRLEDEVVLSKQRLEQELDQPVELFCYPNGDYCDAAVTAVARHYRAAVTTRPGINRASSAHPQLLRRFGVHEDASHNRRKLLARVADWP